MRGVIWIAWRELTARKLTFAIAVAAIAVAVTLCAATELITRAREVAVSSEMDRMGPGLQVLPAGVTASDLAQMKAGAKFLKADLVQRILDDLSPWLRTAEERLVLTQEVAGQQTNVVGLEPAKAVGHGEILRNLKTNEIVVGILLAEKLGLSAGQSLPLLGTDFRVSAVLPSAANTDDLTVFVTLEILRQLTGVGQVVSELRLYPLPGNSLEKAAAFLQSRYSQLRVIAPDRDTEARQSVDDSLQKHRLALYLGMATIAAFCILIWAHLNASDRKVEMATMVAVGGSSLTIFAVIALRAAIVGLIGAMIGYGLGASVALYEDYQSAVPIIASWAFIGALIAGTVALSILGAVPASLMSAFRQHVRALQE
jgi:macrolide transport system ATP-binding/permease protein